MTEPDFIFNFFSFSFLLFKYNFHFIFFRRIAFLQTLNSAPYIGFGRGDRVAPTGLNQGGSVWSFRASPKSFLTTLLRMAQFLQ